MNYIIKQIKLFLFLILFSSSLFASDIYDVEVLRVVDGDTIVVNIYDIPEVFGKSISVRLGRIDTPEIRGKCLGEKQKAQEAKERLQEMINAAQNINLLGSTRDKYFRLLVTTVEADGVDVAAVLLDEGLARNYEGGRKKGWCDYKKRRQKE